MIDGPLVQPSIGLAAQAHRTGPSRLGHVHADAEMMLLLVGTVRYGVAGTVIDLPPGRLVLFSAALPHGVLAASPDAEVAWATVGLDRLLRWDLPGRFLGGLLSGRIAADDGDPAIDRAVILRWVEDLRRGRRGAVQAVALEVEAQVRRFAASADDLPRSPGGDRAARMIAWLAANYRHDGAVAGLAAALGLSPNHAMTVFRAATGVTILHYVTQLRLAHAHRLLATSDMAILEVALEAGFGSQAQFYEVFRRAFACTPAALRRRLGDR